MCRGFLSGLTEPEPVLCTGFSAVVLFGLLIGVSDYINIRARLLTRWFLIDQTRLNDYVDEARRTRQADYVTVTGRHPVTTEAYSCGFRDAFEPKFDAAIERAVTSGARSVSPRPAAGQVPAGAVPDTLIFAADTQTLR